MNVTILGANGAIGRAAVEALAERGHRVRAVSRRLAVLQANFGHIAAAELSEGDINDETTLRRAVAGADAVLHAVGVPYTVEGFRRFPVQTRRVVDACRVANVTSLLVISNEYPYGRPQTHPVSELHPISPVGPKGAARAEQEQVVFAAHNPRGLHTAVLRLPTFFGRGAERVSYLGQAAIAISGHRPAPVLAPVDIAHEWLVVPDAGEVVARIFERGICDGKAYNMAGSGMYTPRRLVEELSRAAGAPTKLRIMPRWAQAAIGWAVPMLRELREVRYLLEVGLTLDETRLATALGGPVHHTPIDEACAAWIADLRRGSAKSQQAA